MLFLIYTSFVPVESTRQINDSSSFTEVRDITTYSTQSYLKDGFEI